MTTNTASLLLALTGWGVLDVERTAEWLDEAEVDYSEFTSFIQSFCSETEALIQSLDLPAMALDFIAHKAHAEELRQHLHSNFLCSSFDIDEDDAGRILYAVEEHRRGAAWHFLAEMTSASAPLENADEFSAPAETLF